MKNPEVKLTETQLKLKERLEYGNISKIAKALGVSREHISLVLSGKIDKQYIWDATEQFLNERDIKRKQSISSLHS